METTTTTTVAKATGWATQTPGEKVFSVAVFGLSTVASVAFAYYLFTDPTKLTDLWAWTRSLPLLVQLVIWLLCLPWMAALWIWSMPWAFAVRIVLVVSILVFTEYLMWPVK